MMILLWVILGIGIYYIAKNNGWINPIATNTNNSANAENLLKNKYVNGDIDEDTYKKMLENIKNK